MPCQTDLIWALMLIRSGRAWKSPALVAGGQRVMTNVWTILQEVHAVDGQRYRALRADLLRQHGAAFMRLLGNAFSRAGPLH